jgi:hypothetical protein
VQAVATHSTAPFGSRQQFGRSTNSPLHGTRTLTSDTVLRPRTTLHILTEVRFLLILRKGGCASRLVRQLSILEFPGLYLVKALPQAFQVNGVLTPGIWTRPRMTLPVTLSDSLILTNNLKTRYRNVQSTPAERTQLTAVCCTPPRVSVYSPSAARHTPSLYKTSKH